MDVQGHSDDENDIFSILFPARDLTRRKSDQSGRRRVAIDDNADENFRSRSGDQ